MLEIAPKPTVFISHKHSDRTIAKAIADFFAEKSGGRIRIYLSSDSRFDGPKFGKDLNAQLRKALWETDVLILIYTAGDQDWSYCMWECGVAIEPQSPETNIIVFQCGSDYPDPFSDSTRVNLRNVDDIRKFVDQFLRDKDFFPSLKGPLHPDFPPESLDKASRQFSDEILKELPPEDVLSQEWPMWPFLRIELPLKEVKKLDQATQADRTALSHQVVKEHGIVIGSDPRAPTLFGLASFPTQMRMEELLKIWKERNPNAESAWFDSCCEQIMTGSSRRFPIIRRTSVREANGESDYTPVLSRIKSKPYARTLQFDLYFYNLSDPQGIPVSSQMIPLNNFFHKRLGEIDPQTFALPDLIKELKARQLNRVPILTSERHPLYIIHRSMVDQFLSETLMASDQHPSPSQLTLAALLANDEMKDTFENTFVVVRRQATLAEAKDAMVTRPNCRDVFITEGGNLNEPVIGWLTNVDIARGF